MIRFLLLMLASLFTLLLTSCGQNSESLELNHPLVIKGNSFRDSGDFKTAAQYYEDYLRLKPDSPRIHLQLAGICNDNLDDPIRSILHYRRFLELSPNSGDADTVRAWLDAAEKRFYEKSRERFELIAEARPGDDEKLKKCLAYIKKLSDENTTLKNEITELKNSINEKELAASATTPAPPVSLPESQISSPPPPPATKPAPALPALSPAAPAPATAATQPAKPKRPEYYTVKANDSLVKISKEIYGTSKYADLIFEANRSLLPSADRLDVGQRLRLPSPPGEQQ